ncbi:MAG: hypothetical protein AAF411_32085, partial [Myxococcota bacterium]
MGESKGVRFDSPATVVALALGTCALWAAAYGSVAPASADDEPVQLDLPARTPRTAPVVPPAERTAGPEPDATRSGPRLLLPPRDGVPGYDIAIEDRDGQSMAALHRALRRAGSGEGQARLVFYGASHVASD